MRSAFIVLNFFPHTYVESIEILLMNLSNLSRGCQNQHYMVAPDRHSSRYVLDSFPRSKVTYIQS